MTDPQETPLVVHLLVPRQGDARTVLVDLATGELPAVTVPREAGESVGEILAALRDVTPLDGFVSVQSIEHTPTWATTRGLAEAEPRAGAPEGFGWSRAGDLATTAVPASLGDGLRRWDLAAGTPVTRETAPWYRPGWRAGVVAWLEGRLGDLGRRLVEPPVVVHGGPIAVVLRARTDAGPVFLKVSIDHFAAEAPVSELLHGRTPGFVPEVLAADRAVGTLMAELPGRPLYDDPEATWGIGLRRLAELQVAWLGGTDTLIGAGAQVRPLAGLAARLEHLEPVHAAMLELPPDPAFPAFPAWPEALAELCRRVESLAVSPVPESLIHGDLHPGNVQVDGERAILFDWSDAAVGHPFVDLVAFLRSVDDPGARRGLLDAYLESWSAGYERVALERAAGDAMVVGALYLVATYLALVPAMDLRNRWQFEHAAPRWLRLALAPMAIAPSA